MDQKLRELEVPDKDSVEWDESNQVAEYSRSLLRGSTQLGKVPVAWRQDKISAYILRLLSFIKYS